MSNIKYLLALSIIFFGKIIVYAEDQIITQVDEAKLIRFGSIEDLLYSVIKTIMYLTAPLTALSLAFLGVKLMLSGDDDKTKGQVKGWMIKILIGSAIVFGSTFIATRLQGVLDSNNVVNARTDLSISSEE